jgi:asparagine synthetase A
VASLEEEKVEVVQSLAKWKRYTLGELNFPVARDCTLT